MSMQRKTDLERFIAAYLECALWSSSDGDGTPLNRLDSELAPETLKRMQDDCAAFVNAQRELLDVCDESGDLPLRGDEARERGLADAYAMAGHDFWLTRNGHGAGFWDGDWRAIYGAEDALTRAAHSFGEFDLYVGDNGLIYGG